MVLQLHEHCVLLHNGIVGGHLQNFVGPRAESHVHVFGLLSSKRVTLSNAVAEYIVPL